MSITVKVALNGVPVPLVLDDNALATIAQQLPNAEQTSSESRSRYLTIREAAELLRCKRQRVDDLLSKGRLTRFKDGRRTLVSHDEVERWIAGG